jgi:DNA-binding TFAR19-related protein (PDSD5 family)
MRAQASKADSGKELIPLSDRELEEIKQRKLREMQRMAISKEMRKNEIDWRQILNKVFKGRAWEVFNTASIQFPEEMVKVREVLVNLAQQGKVKEIQGDQLFEFLKDIGLPVTLNTTITFTSHGKTKLLSEKFKESTKS